MWKCKICGEEVLRFNVVVEAYRIDKNYDEVERNDSFDDSTDEMYYECTECGESNIEDGDVKLEYIAKWVD